MLSPPAPLTPQSQRPRRAPAVRAEQRTGAIPPSATEAAKVHARMSQEPSLLTGAVRQEECMTFRLDNVFNDEARFLYHNRVHPGR